MGKRVILIEESLKDFSTRDGVLGKMRDIYENEEEAIEEVDSDYADDDIDPDDINDTEIFDKVDVSDMDDEDDIIADEDEILSQLRNELLKREPDRDPFEFSVKQKPNETIIGIPMAELRDGEVFVFKIQGVPGLQKILTKDII